MPHICNAVIVTCMDYRLQKYIEDWARQNLGEKNYDRVAVAGGVLDQEFVLKMTRLSCKLHLINQVVLINHEDCGGYGAAGTYRRHCQDLSAIKEKITQQLPRLDIKTYFLHLDGTFEKV